jgi:hypothetical protein
MKLRNIALAVTLSLSCSVTFADANEITSNSLATHKKSIIQEYAEMKGKKESEIKTFGDYIVNGDSLIHINEIKLTVLMKQQRDQVIKEHRIVESIASIASSSYTNGYRVSVQPPKKSDVQDITVSIKKSLNQTNYVPDDWIESTKKAIKELNSIGADFSFRWIEPTSNEVPTIGLFYVYDFPLGDAVAAMNVGSLSEGVGDTFWINANKENLSSSTRYHISMHELLHAVGFHHRGTTDGVMLTGSNTWYTWCTNSVLDSAASDNCWIDDRRVKEISYN